MRQKSEGPDEDAVYLDILQKAQDLKRTMRVIKEDIIIDGNLFTQSEYIKGILEDLCNLGECSLKHSQLLYNTGTYVSLHVLCTDTTGPSLHVRLIIFFYYIGVVDEVINFVLEGVNDVGLCLDRFVFEAAFLFLGAVARYNHDIKQRCVIRRGE